VDEFAVITTGGPKKPLETTAGATKNRCANYRFNLRDRLLLLPLPLAGEGWGGGSRSESVPWDSPALTLPRNRERGREMKETGAAGLAQLVEHVICNHGVGGSNPSAGTNEIKGHTYFPDWRPKLRLPQA
jgi:hypothetical protein